MPVPRARGQGHVLSSPAGARGRQPVIGAPRSRDCLPTPALVIDRDASRALTGLTPEQLEKPMEALTERRIPGLRLIPYRGVGQAEGFLLGMKVTDVILGGKRRPSVVAFAPNSVGGTAYQALIGGSV